MADFDTVIDTMHTRLAALTGFSSKTLIPNPYSITDNPEQFVRNGYGVVVGASTQGLPEFKATFDDQSMDVVLSTEFIRTDSNPDTVQSIAKSLKADALLVRRDFLGDILSGAAKVDYVGTSGLNFEGDYVCVSFNMTISEDIY